MNTKVGKIRCFPEFFILLHRIRRSTNEDKRKFQSARDGGGACDHHAGPLRSLYLWEALGGKDFTTGDAAALLLERYDVDEATAQRDAEAWAAKLAECGVLE